MSENRTFFQAVMDSVRVAVGREPGATQLKGISKEQVVDTVGAITKALDSLPTTTNLHVIYFSLTYVKNAVELAMEENRKALGGQAKGEG